MPEWSNGAVSKTVELSRVPRVRIPLSPPPDFDFNRTASLVRYYPFLFGLFGFEVFPADGGDAEYDAGELGGGG